MREVETHRMRGEVFGPDGDFAEKKPGMDDCHDRDHQEPERRESDEEPTQRLVVRLFDLVGEDHEQYHKECHDEPSGEPVRQLEIVVPLEAELRVGHNDDCQQQDKNNVC